MAGKRYNIEEQSSVELLLNKFGIYSYKFNSSGMLIVSQDVDMSGKQLKSMPFDIHECKGNFDVKGNELETLKGCPKKVSKHFDCSFNRLSTLKYSPVYVGTMFNCSVNIKLENYKGSPRTVGTHFDGSKNPHVFTLEHIPAANTADFALTGIIHEDYEIYTQCVKHETWKQGASMIENLTLLVTKNPLIAKQKWILLEKLPPEFRGLLLSKKLGIL